jgi:hypothetical protein
MLYKHLCLQPNNWRCYTCVRSLLATHVWQMQEQGKPSATGPVAQSLIESSHDAHMHDTTTPSV